VKLSTVQAIVERDRALERLRSRHPVLVQAAALHAATSGSAHPWPATQSLIAFDHWILGELRAMGPAAIEHKVLSMLLGMMQATAFEHLLAITRGREQYGLDRQRMPPQERARHKSPSLAEIDQALLRVAAAFELADRALLQLPTAHDGPWSAVHGLALRIKHLRSLRTHIEHAARCTRRQSAAAQQRRARWALTALAVLASIAAVAGLVWPGGFH